MSGDWEFVSGTKAADDDLGFDLMEYADKATSRDLIPPGEYRAVIAKAEMRTTKAGDGRYVSVELNLLDDQYDGRKVWNNFNVENRSEKATEFGRKDLAVCLKMVGATGKPNGWSDVLNQLQDKIVRVRLTIKDGRNEVAGWLKA